MLQLPCCRNVLLTSVQSTLHTHLLRTAQAICSSREAPGCKALGCTCRSRLAQTFGSSTIVWCPSLLDALCSRAFTIASQPWHCRQHQSVAFAALTTGANKVWRPSCVACDP